MEAKTNEEFFNVSALIDERFGKEGTASRAEAEEKAYAFYTGQIESKFILQRRRRNKNSGGKKRQICHVDKVL